MYKKLKDRPFMTIKFIFLPGRNYKTSMKNWKDFNDWEIKEEIGFIDRINSDDMIKYDIIIDILNLCVVKNRADHISPGEVIQYFTQKYEKNINKAINIWKEKRKQTLNKQIKLGPW
ncbi:MAG: hypothetical protein NZZ41_00945 [Candidatus Dojkabacteria bacterium]|nr:hypothetical protein [Candidatus Dojkabacteria bacterium]